MWKVLFFILLGVLCATIIFSGIFIARLRYDLVSVRLERDEYRGIADGRFSELERLEEGLRSTREVAAKSRERISELEGSLAAAGEYYQPNDDRIGRLQAILRELASRE